jgi:hypothetical protein
LLFHLRRPEAAIESLEESLDGSVADAPVHVLIARCRLELGDAVRALSEVRRAVALAPELVEARELAAWIEAGCPAADDDGDDDGDGDGEGDGEGVRGE